MLEKLAHNMEENKTGSLTNPTKKGRFQGDQELIVKDEYMHLQKQCTNK